jgi:2-polyprenyl-6-hydroxyphenyl methylase/3-demethylubiquinone-9 3-methyltransferase
MGMSYYSRHLAGERLRRCYELAPPPVVRYLEAETSFILERISGHSRVLELGCGYGRVLADVQRRTSHLVGIDTAHESLRLARRLLGPESACRLIETDAEALGLRCDSFDLVFCIQNGLSAFNVDPKRVVAEAIRVARSGSRIICTSYSPRLWPHRLEWFRIQSAHGLLGEIDEQATGEGIIVCRDGFRAGTLGPDDFRTLLGAFGIIPNIVDLDGLSTCCEFTVGGQAA